MRPGQKEKEQWVELKVRFRKSAYHGNNVMTCYPGQSRWEEKDHPIYHGTAYWCGTHRWHVCEKHWKQHQAEDLMEALSK